MKKSKQPYLTQRIQKMLQISIAFVVLLLLILTIVSIGENEYWYLTITAYGAFAVILSIWHRWIYIPFLETNKVLRLFANGYLFQGIYDIRVPYSKESEASYKKFREMLDTKELISVSKKQAEYLALQNQINPHFLYNTLEGIRSEALIAGVDSIAEMTEALSTFFRYTISNVENLVTLEDELANIENYYIIQQFRFGDRLSLSVEFIHDEDIDEMDILQCKLPKLTLQPIVENSIFHGIEKKIGKGNLRIKNEVTTEYLTITITDDGIGIAEEQLQTMRNKLHKMNLEDVNPQENRKGGIAIFNVNNRIKLLFGEEYGINIYSTVNVGTDVEVRLPLIRE